jgi:hypothetical protein
MCVSTDTDLHYPYTLQFFGRRAKEGGGADGGVKKRESGKRQEENNKSQISRDSKQCEGIERDTEDQNNYLAFELAYVAKIERDIYKTRREDPNWRTFGVSIQTPKYIKKSMKEGARKNGEGEKERKKERKKRRDKREIDRERERERE